MSVDLRLSEVQALLRAVPNEKRRLLKMKPKTIRPSVRAIMMADLQRAADKLQQYINEEYSD